MQLDNLNYKIERMWLAHYWSTKPNLVRQRFAKPRVGIERSCTGSNPVCSAKLHVANKSTDGRVAQAAVCKTA